ncbi:hypothetical protein, partial [Pseudofrankia sp. BMG5.36]|uniref:hypothetical protein n=1 Tax=Pseudofrankia sp. BMG5.36 TaxID=1834512 RepID=UPI001041EF58
MTKSETITSIMTTPSIPSGVGVMALSGTSPRGKPLLTIVREDPCSFARVVAPLPKDLLETLHIQRFAVDCRCATGSELFHAIEKGSDPPDVVAHLDNGVKVGWELTVFSIEERRAAHRLFGQVREALAFQQRHRVGHLIGYMVYIWFGTSTDLTGLPFRRNDHNALIELVDSLVSHRPDPTALLVEDGELPQNLKLAQLGLVRTPSDATYLSAPMLGGAPTSMFFALTGFELGLAFQSCHEAPAGWDSLRTQIARKDRPGNDRLLISAGAPDRLGQCYPAEELLADFLLQHPEPVQTRHLQSVVIHFWSSGRAVELVAPQPTELWPPPYTGHVPAHPGCRQSPFSLIRPMIWRTRSGWRAVARRALA